MSALTPYLHFDATAREALEFYAEVFGCGVALHTLADFHRTDGPPDAIAHGYLVDGPIDLFGADASGDQRPFAATGLMFALLGAAPAETLHQWFDRLADRGQVIELLERREWGAWDGQVIDRFGVPWLIGYEES